MVGLVEEVGVDPLVSRAEGVEDSGILLTCFNSSRPINSNGWCFLGVVAVFVVICAVVYKDVMDGLI